MGAKRQAKRRDWPPNLYQQPNGYFYWRNPKEKKNYGLGRDKAAAFREARAANAHLATLTKSTLVQRISGVESFTFEKWLDRYMEIWPQEIPEKAPATIAIAKRFISRFKEAEFAWLPVPDITTKHIATYLDGIKQSSTLSVAINMRARLQDIFRCAQEKGLIASGTNPVPAYKLAGYEVKRERLSLEQFFAIREKVPPWAQNGMDLALVTGQRISDVVSMQFSDYKEGSLFIIQQKTGYKLQQDGGIRLGAIGKSIDDVVKQCRDRVISKYLIHHPRTSGNYKKGDQVSADGLSRVFAMARDEVGIAPEDGRTPPTFHEIRSLAERLYKKEYGQEFAQSIMGHKHAKQTAEYDDMRGGDWKVVAAK